MKVYGNLMNRVAENSRQKAPEIGDGVTITCYSDRHAGTIIAKTAKTITVQRDFAKRIDKNGMSESQEYEYSSDPKGMKEIFRLTKRGWRNKVGNGLVIGERDEYYDFSF